MKNSKSKKANLTKVENVENKVDDNVLLQNRKRDLKVEFSELFLLDNPTKEQNSRMVVINKALKEIAKDEKQAQKEIDARMKLIETQEKAEKLILAVSKAATIMKFELENVLNELYNASAKEQIDKTLISKLLGQLPTIAKQVRAELPNAGTKTNAERNADQLEKALLHIENGGDISTLPVTTQKSYFNSLV